MSIVSQIRSGHSRAVRAAGVVAAFHTRSWVADDPMDTAAQWTVATKQARVLLGTERVKSQEESEGYRLRSVVTVSQGNISTAPDQGDIIEIGGLFYTVVLTADHHGALWRIPVEGPTQVPTVTADVTAPTVSAFVLNSGQTAFTFTATSDEACHFRLRHRIAPALWSTQAWATASYVTSIAGTSITLDPGTYEVDIQARDAVPNVGRWFRMGTVIISGIPA